MSKENVAIVRVAFEAFSRQDMDGALKHATSDFTVDLSRAVGLDRGIYDADAWRRMTDEFANTWESVEWRLDEFIDAGAQVVTPFTNQLRGRDGIEIEAHGFWVWTIRDRAIAMLSYYEAREQAFEAAGLSE
jgi:ketosteroid isomerase-like protein